MIFMHVFTGGHVAIIHACAILQCISLVPRGKERRTWYQLRVHVLTCNNQCTKVAKLKVDCDH